MPRIVKKVSFIAMGDVPYTKDSRYCLNKQLRDLNQERMDFKFVVHVGDLKYGKQFQDVVYKHIMVQFLLSNLNFCGCKR